MNHFEPITPENRWKNDVLEEMRKQTALLSSILEILQKAGGTNANITESSIPIESAGKGQQRQRRGNRNRKQSNAESKL